MSTKPRIVQTVRFPLIEDELETLYDVVRLWEVDDRDAALAIAGLTTRAIVSGAATGASCKLMRALPHLALVALHGVGTDSTDLAYAAQRRIRVTTTQGILTEDVADMAMGLMIAVCRRLIVNDRFVRDGRWSNDKPHLARRVSGKRLGIVGLGRIGREIARRAAAFNMQVNYCDVADLGAPYGFVPDIPQLARDSDILVLSASVEAKTGPLVGREALEALGPEGVIINVARGNMIDESALVSALVEGRLGGAGLDVFAREPEVPSELLTLENVVVQPHQASATHETRRAMGRNVLDNLAAYFAGLPLVTPVNDTP